MDRFIIQGGVPLNGTITASGNKNAALKLLPACLLTDEPVTLHNVPDIADVRTMIRLVQSLGAEVVNEGGGTLRVHAKNIDSSIIDRELATQIRASIVLAGPLLARVGYLELPPPGGDVIGRRRVDTHVLAMKQLGASCEFNSHFIFKTDGLRGTDILLDEASVTATENTIMAAVLAKGTTIIRNAACEPHVQDLCHFLNTLGAQIEGIGSNVLTIHGVDRLHGGEFRIGADYIEVGSFIGAAAVTRGRVRIQNADPHHLHMIHMVFNRLGVHWETDGNDVIVPEYQPLKIVPDIGDQIPEIKAQPWPAFPSDLLSIALVVANTGRGHGAVPRVDVREPLLLRGQADLHGCARGAVRPAPLHHPGTEPAPRREGPYHQPGHPRGHVAAARGTVRGGHDHHPQRGADRPRLRERRGQAARAGRQDRAQL